MIRHCASKLLPLSLERGFFILKGVIQMIERNIQQLAEQLREATDPAAIASHANVLAKEITPSVIGSFVLAAEITLRASQRQYNRGILERRAYIDIVTQESGKIEDAKKYLGPVGEELIDSLITRGDEIASAISHPEGQVLNEEAIACSRRLIAHEAFGVPPKILRRANADVINREKS